MPDETWSIAMIFSQPLARHAGSRLVRWALCAAVVLLTSSARSFAGSPTPLVTADFTGVAPALHTPWIAASAVAPGITYGGWTRGSGAIGAAIDDAFAFSVNATGVESTLADALAEGEYVACSLDSSAPLDLSAARFDFTVHRRSWHAPRRYALFASAIGFAPEQAILVTNRLESGDFLPRAFSAYLPESLSSVTGPIEFRIYAFEANWGGHATSLTVAGIVTGIKTCQLELTVVGDGAVILDPNRTVFEIGESITLRAAPAAGSRFAGLSGDLPDDGSPRRTPRTVVMDGDRAITATFEPSMPAAMTVGMNLDGVTDWSTAWVYTDLFRRMRPWLTRNADGSGAWNSGFGALAPTDDDGWPTLAPFDPDGAGPIAPQMLHSILVRVNAAGTYTVTWQGSASGRIRADGSPWQPIVPGQRALTLAVDADDAITLEILATGPSDPIRAMSIVRNGADPTALFEPPFLDRLAGTRLLRFMDWARTNASPAVHWSDRTRPTAATQSAPAGVAIEHMVALANATAQDAWLCVPHLADDEWVREALRLVRDTLDPSLRLWLEYSNETWNTAGPFTQTQYASQQGIALGLAGDSFTAANRYTALRSAQIFAIADEEFAATPSRLVRVLATQSANMTVTNQRLAAFAEPALNPTGTWPDALAIAPYFGTVYSPAMLPPNVPSYPTVDQIVGPLSTQAIAAALADTAEQKLAADAAGLELVCYEAGQHFVGVLGAENDTTLEAILHAANRDERMGDRYTEYLDGLRAAGVALCANFSHCGAWTKWGSFSILERLDQPDAEAPKFRAVAEWIAANGCPGDLDGDGVVGSGDLAVLLGAWGECAAPRCTPDLDGDATVGTADLAMLLGAWSAPEACAP